MSVLHQNQTQSNKFRTDTSVELKKVLSVTKHGFVLWAQQCKPNTRLEIYKAFPDRLTFLNRPMVV